MENPDPSSGAYYKALTRNTAAIIIIVCVAPLMLIAGTMRHYFIVSYNDKAVDYLRVLVRKHSQSVDSFVNDKLAAIQLLARSATFEQFSDPGFLQDRLATVQEEFDRSFVDLGVVDSRGIQVAYAGPYRLKGADYSQAKWFKEAFSARTCISDVFPGLRGAPHFVVAVQCDQNGNKWVLRATIDFDTFNNLVRNLRVGTTGSAFVLNNQGALQTKHRETAPPAEALYQDLLNATPKTLDDVTVHERPDEHSLDTVYVTSRMKAGQWLLVYHQAADEVFSASYRARRVSVLVFLVGVAAIVFTAVVVSKRIVSHLARAEREKEMMNQQVIEAGKLASLGELAAGIAHEINNPVAIMAEEAGWIEDLILEDDCVRSDNAEELSRALRQIKTQAQRCKEITHKLLSFARKTDPTIRSVRINDTVEEVLALSEQRARYGNVRISTSLAPDLPPVKASPSEIQQVLLNLINNSLDAMESKGGTIQVETRLENHEVQLDVTDNGTGIAQANMARIFEPFFTTKSVGKGTGLGLSICYGIIKRMGGEITVNSAPGAGTSFHIRIPVPPATPRETKVEQADRVDISQ